MKPTEDCYKDLTIIGTAYMKQSPRKRFLFLCFTFSCLSICLLAFLWSTSRAATHIYEHFCFSFIWLGLYVTPKQKVVNPLEETETPKKMVRAGRISRTVMTRACALQTKWAFAHKRDRFYTRSGGPACFRGTGWWTWEARGVWFRNQLWLFQTVGLTLSIKTAPSLAVALQWLPSCCGTG